MAEGNLNFYFFIFFEEALRPNTAFKLLLFHFDIAFLLCETGATAFQLYQITTTITNNKMCTFIYSFG